MAKLVDIQLPPGEYYIGDLCYVMHNEWTEMCGVICDDNVPHSWTIELDDGRLVAGSFTAYGDGEYSNTMGKALGVDAGLIGVIQTKDIAHDDIKNMDLGLVHTFTVPFTVTYSGGDIRIGDQVVYTGDMDDEEDDYDYSDDDEDY